MNLWQMNVGSLGPWHNGVAKDTAGNFHTSIHEPSLRLRHRNSKVGKKSEAGDA